MSSSRLPRPVSGIVQGLVDEVVLGRAALGDVLRLGHRVGGPAVVVLDDPGREERPEGVAVGGDEAQLDAQAPGPAVAQLGQPALEVVGVLGVREGDEVRGPDHVGVEAEHPAQAGVGLPDASVELDDGHADRGVRERRLEPGDRLTAGGLGPLPTRDVLDVEHEARRASVVAPRQRRVELDPHGVTVGVAEPDVDVEAVDRVVEGAPGELEAAAAVVGVDEVGQLGAGQPAGSPGRARRPAPGSPRAGARRRRPAPCRWGRPRRTSGSAARPR